MPFGRSTLGRRPGTRDLTQTGRPRRGETGPVPDGHRPLSRSRSSSIICMGTHRRCFGTVITARCADG